jgi:hypothetical protein
MELERQMLRVTLRVWGVLFGIVELWNSVEYHGVVECGWGGVMDSFKIGHIVLCKAYLLLILLGAYIRCSGIYSTTMVDVVKV